MKTKHLHVYFLLLVSFISSLLHAQNGSTCYKPLTGAGKVASPINNNVVCVSLNDDCNFLNNLSYITDSDTTNKAVTSSSLAVGEARGVSVRDDVNTYPVGYYAGFVLDLGGQTLLKADILSAFTVSTYNDAAFMESRTGASIAAATALGNQPGRYYIYFKTTKNFDEIRFTYTSTISALSYLGIYYATAFDPGCGTLENNNLCGDQIAGIGTVATFNNGGGLLTAVNALTSITNPNYLTDGDKNTPATITLPASVAGLTGYPYVGVLDEKRIYPSGSVTGFVISRPSIATVDVLSSLRIQTYLFGSLQEEGTYSSGINIGLLTGSNDRTSIAITTTKPYNEVRLVIATTAAINAGLLNVYYAYEQPANCSDCTDKVVSSNTAPYNSAAVSFHDPDGALGVQAAHTSALGICVSVGGNYSLSGTPNVTDEDTSNYASYKYGGGLSLGIACGFQIGVKMSSPIPGGAIAGFVIGVDNTSLLNAGLLEAVTIRTYRNNTLVATSNNSNLLALSILLANNGTRTRVGFRSAVEFDEIQIQFVPSFLSASLLNLLNNATVRTYYPFVIRDDDNDGVLNCHDKCATGNDAIDTDGNGYADCYEALILPLTFSDFSAKATAAKKVALTWQTLNETNTKQFVLERSSTTTVSNWKTITTFNAAGNTTGSRTYTYTDVNPFDGTNYYRVRSIDKDGKETISVTRQVSLSSKALLSASIYPNPVKAGSAVQIATLQDVNYRLLDQTGRTVLNGKILTGNHALFIPAIHGVYILEIQSVQTTGWKETHKIIVQ